MRHKGQTDGYTGKRLFLSDHLIGIFSLFYLRLHSCFNCCINAICANQAYHNVHIVSQTHDFGCACNESFTSLNLPSNLSCRKEF